MCGIFGLAVNETSHFDTASFRSVVGELFKLSESRGKEASGLALMTGDQIRVMKRAVSPSQIMRSWDYRQFFDFAFSKNSRQTIRQPAALIGHARMETDGSHRVHGNNQPVCREGIVTVHNGIIVNPAELWLEFPELRRELEVDTEIIPALMGHHYRQGASLVESVRSTYRRIEGMASIAALFDKLDYLLLASNNGSLYLGFCPAPRAVVFASERSMLKTLMAKFPGLASSEVTHLKAGSACLIQTSDLSVQFLSLETQETGVQELKPNGKARRISDISSRPFTPRGGEGKDGSLLRPSGWESLLQDNRPAIDRLKRCRRCILSETLPFILFDDEGICNVCRTFSPVKYRGVSALEELAAPHRKTNGEPDCIVAASGGRDSSFMLHTLKAELGMNPVAFTYDWGMVTPLARRNISRLCGKLGVEHILISADIQKKREFIRQNVNAWLKRPRLGTVPLFMAGDKQFFFYGRMLRKQLDTPLLFFGMNALERTDFKVAFSGIQERRKRERHYDLSLRDRLELAVYYGKEYLLNPAYLNRSVGDTLSGFASYYLIGHDYHNFYEYIEWEEGRILETLRDRYDWETRADTPTTWRIGDGTAAFYNYIYYTVAGFTENDTFRSNQIRQGLISREKALREAGEENRPRPDSIRWYGETNGIDLAEAIRIINQMPKLYPV